MILAGVKPLEEAYRDRNQSCRLKVEALHVALTPELVKSTLGLRNAQIKRYLVNTRDTGSIDDVTIVLGRVSSSEILAFVVKLKNLDGVNKVDVVSRDVGAPEAA